MSMLAEVLNRNPSDYKDRRFEGTEEQYREALLKSTTVYVGNLSFYTSEDQLYAIFNTVGPVKKVIMGLDRKQKTPCGFCFVEYFAREHTEAALAYVNGMTLDKRPIRVDLDYGFREGRQYGRGRSGGQVRDEFRTTYDKDRGGFGRLMAQELLSLYGKKAQEDKQQRELELRKGDDGMGTQQDVEEGAGEEGAGGVEEGDEYEVGKKRRRDDDVVNPRHRDLEQDEDG